MKPLVPLACLALLVACAGHAPPRPPPPPATSTTAGTTTATPPPSQPEVPAAPPAPAPPPPEVLVARARALRAEGDLAGARAQLETALEATPGSDDVRLELADLLIADGGDLDRAGALLVSVGTPGGGQLFLVLGRLADARGDDDTAVAAYSEALAAVDDTDARLRRGLALERLGRRAEAVADLERVRADRPADTFARGRLAALYERAGRLHEAEAELRWLAELAPGLAAGWERLARFYGRTGHPRAAQEAQARARAAGGRQERALRPLLPSRS